MELWVWNNEKMCCVRGSGLPDSPGENNGYSANGDVATEPQRYVWQI